jgi:hypothetical protein
MYVFGQDRVGVLHPKAIVYYRERRWSMTSLGEWLTLKWRACLGLRARSIGPICPSMVPCDWS